LPANGLDLVSYDGPVGEFVAGVLDPFSQQRAGLVGRLVARIGDGQDRDPQRIEVQALVNSSLGSLPTASSRIIALGGLDPARTVSHLLAFPKHRLGL
jgi:hypothetical protein